MTQHILAGGAGFIGTNLITEIRQQEPHSKITIIDNLSNPSQTFSPLNSEIDFIDLDLANSDLLLEKVCHRLDSSETTKIWHLAANSDIPSGIADLRIDLHNTFLTTVSLLLLARQLRVETFIFASSSAIYGYHGSTRLTESTHPLKPISNYGAMKLASEVILSTHFASYPNQLRIFRFPNVVGPPATHGVIYDFINKLLKNPAELHVLGNGSQQKAYLYVTELCSCMYQLSQTNLKQADSPIFNIGPTDTASVKFIAETVRDLVSPTALIKYGNADRGWEGDVPRFSYDNQKSIQYGCIYNQTSQLAVSLATKDIFAQLTH